MAIAFSTFDGARDLNGITKQQHLLCHSGFTSIRVRNDGKRTALGKILLIGTHKAILWASVGSGLWAAHYSDERGTCPCQPVQGPTAPSDIAHTDATICRIVYCSAASYYLTFKAPGFDMTNQAVCLFKNILLPLLLAFSFASHNSLGDDWTSARPDGHAPIGVMGDHAHKQGEWMFSYRTMHMDMDGNRNGDSKVSTTDVLADFVVSPTSMTMDMQMFGAMYAPSDMLTLTVMVPYIELEMDHVNRMGTSFTTKSSGLGDVKLGGLYTLQDGHNSSLLLNFSISLPTGSNTEEGTTPAGKVRLPYPMQLGSGTYDFLPGLTYLSQSDQYSWGAQGIATIRTGKDQGYRLGNRFDGTLWLAKKLSDSLSISVRVSGEKWGDIKGADDKISRALMPMGMGPFPSVPTAFTNLRGGSRANFAVGANYYIRSGFASGHRLAAELGVPIYQTLDGPQLETNWTATLGWQLAL
jgi:hypothetical protein